MLCIKIAAAAVPAKTKGPSTPQKMPVSAQPKAHHADRLKEKPRYGASEAHRPKVHDGPHREHRTSHRSNVMKDGSKVAISKDGLKEGSKEIVHEVAREREAHALSAVHRDGATRLSASSTAHRPGTRHSEELRSKPLQPGAAVTAKHRLSSDSQPLSAGPEARLAGALKAEAKLSTKMVCFCHNLIALFSYRLCLQYPNARSYSIIIIL